MRFSSALTAIAAASVSLACDIPPGTLPNDVPEGFAIQVQNASYPIVHNRLLNQWSAGGGDQHLYLSPAGNETHDLTLVDGIITQHHGGQLLHAVINGEYTEFDNTTKMFMTERGDPRAIYDVVYGCNPDTDALQKELHFKARADLPGGHICVRLASGDRHEFRYSPPGNTASDNPERQCIKVNLAMIPA